VLLNVRANGFDIGRASGIDLVDHDHVSPTHVDFARVIGQFVSGAVRIDDYDFKIGSVERGVVVAAIPKNNVGFLFGTAKDPLVVDAGIHDRTALDVGFILLALFDGALIAI
jgi:hypothetical protein